MLPVCNTYTQTLGLLSAREMVESSARLASLPVLSVCLWYLGFQDGLRILKAGQCDT